MPLLDLHKLTTGLSRTWAGYLRDWASKINMEKIKKAPPRKPTKQKTKRIKDDSPHLSTARLLEEAKNDRKANPRVRNQR